VIAKDCTARTAARIHPPAEGNFGGVAEVNVFAHEAARGPSRVRSGLLEAETGTFDFGGGHIGRRGRCGERMFDAATAKRAYHKGPSVAAMMLELSGFVGGLCGGV